MLFLTRFSMRVLLAVGVAGGSNRSDVQWVERRVNTKTRRIDLHKPLKSKGLTLGSASTTYWCPGMCHLNLPVRRSRASRTYRVGCDACGGKPPRATCTYRIFRRSPAIPTEHVVENCACASQTYCEPPPVPTALRRNPPPGPTGESLWTASVCRLFAALTSLTKSNDGQIVKTTSRSFFRGPVRFFRSNRFRTPFSLRSSKPFRRHRWPRVPVHIRSAGHCRV